MARFLELFTNASFSTAIECIVFDVFLSLLPCRCFVVCFFVCLFVCLFACLFACLVG